MSNNIFAEIAKKETSLSPVLQGRTKVSVSEIMSKYPDGVTIVEFDLIRTRDKQGEESEYVMVEDEVEFEAVSGVFSQMLEDDVEFE